MRAKKEPDPIVEPAFKVHEVVLLRVGLLNKAPYNPKGITPGKLEALKRTIREDGFVQNLVVQKHSERHGDNVLIDGHQRIRAIHELCIEDNKPVPECLPCVVLDVPDRAAKKLNIKLERVGGHQDNKLLGELLEDLNSEQVLTPDDVSSLGFEEEEFGKLLHLADPPPVTPSDDVPVFGRSVTLSLEFRDVGMRDAVKAKLLERAQVEGKTTGEIVLSLLDRPKKK